MGEKGATMPESLRYTPHSLTEEYKKGYQAGWHGGRRAAAREQMGPQRELQVELAKTQLELRSALRHAEGAERRCEYLYRRLMEARGLEPVEGAVQ